jgi:hypothetical protein
MKTHWMKRLFGSTSGFSTTALFAAVLLAISTVALGCNRSGTDPTEDADNIEEGTTDTTGASDMTPTPMPSTDTGAATGTMGGTAGSTGETPGGADATVTPVTPPGAGATGGTGGAGS